MVCTIYAEGKAKCTPNKLIAGASSITFKFIDMLVNI